MNYSFVGKIAVAGLSIGLAAMAIPCFSIGSSRVKVATAKRARKQVQNVELPPGTTLQLHATAYAWDNLTLSDGCVLTIDPAITGQQISISVNTLTLSGQSTIDLTHAAPTPPKPATPPGRGQAPNNGSVPRAGDGGLGGAGGSSGLPGFNLNMKVTTFNGSAGSLWIRTDGNPGGPGGDGGAGGKGSSGPRTGIHNPDGGNGGNGGSGGGGGRGGDTSFVVMTVGGNKIKPTGGSGVSPSTRPSEATVLGGIVIFGSPGAGGPGGNGGPGGPGGEGHKKTSIFNTDSRGGANGGSGAHGPAGPNGTFRP